MAHMLDHFGPALLEPWTRLEAPPLTPELRDRMVAGCETEAAGRVESAVRDVIAEGATVTYDLGGSTGTREFGAVVAQRLAGG